MTGGRVVILGSTGKNFAAGMSGGIAYVWDPKGKFATKCNKSLVSLEPLSDEVVPHPMIRGGIDDENRTEEKPDSAFVKELIEEHLQLTDSEVAREILAQWDSRSQEIIRVMPNDYRRAIMKNTDTEDVAVPAVVEPLHSGKAASRVDDIGSFSRLLVHIIKGLVLT
jgi:glutamate synthase domain-containing protein 3